MHRYAMERLDELDRLGFASTLAADSESAEPRTRTGWEQIPSSAPAVARRCRGTRRERSTGATVLVTGGSRGIGKAIALRLARVGAARVAIGYFRSDAAAEETAEELRALGAEPVLVRGNITSERVLEQVAALGPLRRPRAQRRHRRDPPGARDRGQALGLDAPRERARAALAHPGRGARDAVRLVDRRDLQPRLDPRAGELRAGRHVEGGARGARALPRGRARAARHPRQRRLGAAWSRRARSSTSRTATQMVAMGARNPVGRLVTPEDVAAAVAFLCSEDADMVRGQTRRGRRRLVAAGRLTTFVMNRHTPLPALVLDWDGTVTERDTLHMVIERFGDLDVFHAAGGGGRREPDAATR